MTSKWKILLITLVTTIGVNAFAQEVTLDYIFQDTNVINPRPLLKQINGNSNKIYYYADDMYDGNLHLFDYNYVTGETYKYSDSLFTPSEFIVLPNGDAITIIHGNLFISKHFTETRNAGEDMQLTHSEKDCYSPQVFGDIVTYRRGGNYFLTRFDSLKATSKELQLTRDESDSVSYQIMTASGNIDSNGTLIRLFVIRYDNSTKQTVLIPNYMHERVTIDKRKRGIAVKTLLEIEIKVSAKKSDSLYIVTDTISYPESSQLSTQDADYSPDKKTLILDAESLDRHKRKIFAYNVKSGFTNEIYSEEFNGWFERHENGIRFLDDSNFMFESEISGYNSLYKMSISGSQPVMIAGGEYTILRSVCDRANGKLYFVANIDMPIHYNIYETDFNGAPPRQLTFISGDNENLKISPDGKYLFFEHSYLYNPNELYSLKLYDLKEQQITNTISPKFTNVDWVLPQVINFNNEEDGQLIYAFLYKPKDFNPKKKYPLICFVHGAGYMQNVTMGFSPYQDNFMVNTYLVSKGYVILDVDFRGSAGYGREFRNKTYRNLGYWEVSDYISGVDYLDKQGIINKDKVGIYGGSYGGFVTLMALFRHPEVFKCGVALRAVSNWENYHRSNWWFTLARLGDPGSANDKQYYEISSPITYAENLNVPLLIIHGMLDDNVFFQDMVQLTQKLIDLKKDFNVMFYPKESHGFHIQSSWLDQYKRIDSFFEEHLK